MKRKPKCPTCGREADAQPANPWRPFCSERCRLIDLGDWIAGRHRIPAEEPATAEQPEEPGAPLIKH